MMRHIINRPISFYKKIINKRAIILAYHRVFNSNSDPQLLAVSPTNFDEQISVIKKNYNPISFENLIFLIDNKKKIPANAVVLTFDDGYLDNYIYAKEILEFHKVSATFFITSGYINSIEEFWWDELERLILLQENFPNVIDFSDTDLPLLYEIFDTETDRLRQLNWNVLDNSNLSSRQSLYLTLHRLIKPLPSEKIYNILNKIKFQLGHTIAPRPDYRVVNQNELKLFANSDFVEIGAHSITHPVLSAQTPERQMEEIFESKNVLAKILGRDINFFSYPFGSCMDIGKVAPKLVFDAGYRAACANFEGLVSNNSDRFVLPRFLVRNWNGDQLLHHMNQWLTKY